MEGKFEMSKRHINRYLCIAGMIIFFVLIVHDFAENSEYKIGSLATHTGLFIAAVYFLYLNLKNERKMKDGDRKS